MSAQAAVIVLSDRAFRGIREDRSGPEAVSRLAALGFRVAETVVLPDEGDRLRNELVRLVDFVGVALVVTCGGTGLSPRDVTPQTTKALLDYEVPGIPETMRAAGRAAGLATASLSRALAGVRGRTLIVNLPGSPRGVAESLDAIGAALPHAVQSLRGEIADCAAVRGETA